MKQHTLASEISFNGHGLHTGKTVNMVVCPAAENSGIVFCRTDLSEGAPVEVSIENFRKARRCTLLKKGKVRVRTPEHLLSALAGMGIDNALIKIDREELPILDGSAKPYVEAISAAGIVEQEAQRRYIEVVKPFEFKGNKYGSLLRIEPADSPSYEVTIDFGSQVLGVQTAVFDQSVDYAAQIAPCRTFCFMKEIRMLRFFGLIKGGRLDNALVIDEPNGYYGNPELNFENECARHKLLDLMGDFSLAGLPVRGRIYAYKPGHRFNASALKAFLDQNK